MRLLPPIALPGISDALGRIMDREVDGNEVSPKVVVEAVNTAADRLERVEQRLDELERD